MSMTGLATLRIGLGNCLEGEYAKVLINELKW